MCFKEVKEHHTQINFLRKLIRQGRVGHAYLFVGREGIGKRQVAKSFAQALNCQEIPGEGCGICVSCRKIENQIHPDFFILEAKDGSLKIDQVRDLLNRIIYPPFEGKMKVVIINDAEKMTVQAANCLLKSLEESLPETIFILITQDLRSILPTIVSRCQILRFHPLSTQSLQELLQEKLKGETEINKIHLSLAGGSVSSALKLIESNFLREREEFLRKLSELPKSGVSAALDLALETASAKETQNERLGLLKIWYHDLMFYKKEGMKERIVNQDLYQKLEEEAGRFTFSDLFSRWILVRETETFLNRNVNPQLAFERLFLMLAGPNEVK